MTAAGCCIFLTPFTIPFQKSTVLSTLMPAEVDPAQAHCRAKKIINNWVKGGHRELSMFAKPVEVPMEMT